MVDEVRTAALREAFAPLFRPRTVAVVGASATSITRANEFIRHSLTLGFTGRIYPIHPTASSIENLAAYRSFADVPEPIDYAFIAIPAPKVPSLLAGAGGRVKFAQVMSSGFGETETGKDRETALVRAARAGGLRVLGPNCLGTYSPRGGLVFVGGASPSPGPVGVISQSGGLATDMIRRGGQRGLRFSGVVTMGNSADLGPNDLLEYFLADPETTVIGMYLEDVKDGRRFFSILSEARAFKPVVLLIGGRTRQGQRAAASHTGSLATEDRIWMALARQTGAILVETLEQYLDTLLAFQHLRPHPDQPTTKVVLFGNGGGASVLAADVLARVGLELAPTRLETRQALERLELLPGTGLDNPIDAPSGTLKQEEGRIAERILDVLFTVDRPDALILHINLPQFLGSLDQRVDVFGNLVQAAIRSHASHRGRAHFLLVLRSDGDPAIEARKRTARQLALGLGIPVYDEVPPAALALAAISQYERFAAREPASARPAVTGPPDQ